LVFCKPIAVNYAVIKTPDIAEKSALSSDLGLIRLLAQ
jgi:hypothetical protein